MEGSGEPDEVYDDTRGWGGCSGGGGGDGGGEGQVAWAKWMPYMWGEACGARHSNTGLGTRAGQGTSGLGRVREGRAGNSMRQDTAMARSVYLCKVELVEKCLKVIVFAREE